MQGERATMEGLQDFASKSFIDQMMLLDAVERTSDASATDGLVAILENPATDASIRQAVSDTLRSLLRAHPGDALRLLRLGPGPSRRIAVQLAGELALPEAEAPLIDIIAAPAPEELLDAYAALAAAGGKNSASLFRKGATHPEPLISALCIQALAELGDTAALPLLARMLAESDADGKFESCAVTTQAAIEALARLDTPEATEALVRKIHHRNPTARRIIHAMLVGKGQAVLDRLGRFFTEGTFDEQIMAANLIGFIGHPRGADLLLGVMDKGALANPNVRFAILEALGRIPSLKGLVCLVDSLLDDDDMILVAVASGLNHCDNPGALRKVAELLARNDERSRRVARAIATARAADLFTALYEDEKAADALVAALRTIRDMGTLESFRETLSAIGTDRAKADAARLVEAPPPSHARRVLAVDDSKSVLLFYKTVVADLGYEVCTAQNGREALDILGQDSGFDLILTDLNMPEMDGIELTTKVRENFLLASLPIIMATTESEGSQVQIAMKAGVNGFLSKPVSPPKIEAMLKEVLG